MSYGARFDDAHRQPESISAASRAGADEVIE